jgi:hypothetical protein
LLVEAGLIGAGTVVATTVHPLQVLAEAVPGHDVRLDLIVAGEEVIACRRTRRPPGILWGTSTRPRSPPSPPWPPGRHTGRAVPAGRERFCGWIAGLGTAGGHRIVVGHWSRSPYGVVTDAMVQDPAGRRTLYAPTRQLATFLGAAYRFDDVQVVPCSARRSGRRRVVEAGPLRLSFTTGRRTLLGWLLRAVPAPLARTTWWVGLLDLPARRLLPGVRTRGRTRDGRRQWYGAHDLHAIVDAAATLSGRDLGALCAVHPLVGFGFGSVPSRPSLVHLTTTIEAARPPNGGDVG